MKHYFTREEAEALLPAIAIVLRRIQDEHREMRSIEKELEALQAQAMGNGHHLYERIQRLQQKIEETVQALRTSFDEILAFGCELKDPESGLIDFLSLSDDEEIYLCWRLGEDRIRFWHYLDTGFSGRQPL